jgi:transglutaminase-like putative cysteine protease
VTANAFFERARDEARRYGPDPWVFVRELVQNARDAGASTITFEIRDDGTRTTVRCHDDGEGMSFTDAERFLFSLYSSSKEDASDQVGRFGVGFWSVLRFEPDRITIRSRRRRDPDDAGWEIVLRDGLRDVRRRSISAAAGTEVLLGRPSDPTVDVAAEVAKAARENARFLATRDDRDRPLRVLVDGRPVNQAFALGAPSASYRRRGARVVVGLGREPRVELFSRGLRVRAATSLDDLLSNDRTAGTAPIEFPTVVGAMAPQAYLDGDAVEVMLSRSDARDTRALRRMVEHARKQLRRLVRRQLDRSRPPSVIERFARAGRKLADAPIGAQILGAGIAGAGLALVLAAILWEPKPSTRPGGLASPVSATALPPPPVYRDLASQYRGPHVSVLTSSTARPLDLIYEPADLELMLGTLVVPDLDAETAVAAVTEKAYAGRECVDGCVRLALPVDTPAGDMRLPLAAGHVVDPRNMQVGERVRGRDWQLMRTEAGDPAVRLIAPFRGTVTYTTGPGMPEGAVVARRPHLTPELRRDARQVATAESVDDAARVAIDRVQARVRYATDAATAEAHRQRRERGQGFMARALAIGAGDCDIQNGIVAALMQDAGYDARLVIGYLGKSGRVSPWLHAWVEIRGDDGQWFAADASERPPGAPPSSALNPTAEPSSPAPAVAAPNSTAGPDASPLPPSEGEATSRAAVVTRPLAAWLASLPLSALAGTGALGLVLALMLLWVWWQSRVHVELTTRSSTGAMLRGALSQPQAFAHLPDVFTRRLIPQRGRRRAISLLEARRRGANGSLTQATGRTELARDAVARGLPVIDAETDEGREVGRALGAVDLDHVGELWNRAEPSALLEAIATRLDEAGERWLLRVCSRPGRAVTSLDLRAVRLARLYGADRLVIIDRDDPTWTQANDVARRAPARAHFAALDMILDRLELPDARRGALLQAPARAAVAERIASAGSEAVVANGGPPR